MDFSWDDIEDEPALPGGTPVTPPEPKSQPWAITRGAVTGIHGVPEDFGGAAEVFRQLTGGDENSYAAQLAKWFGEVGKNPEAYKPQVPSVTDITGPSSALTYAGEQLGQGIGSTLPSLVGGTAGAIGGTAAAGPVGGVAGAVVGTAIPSLAAGVGGSYREFMGDEGIQQALKDGKLTTAQLAKYAAIAGGTIGVLDAIPVLGWATKLGGATAAKTAIRSSALTAIKKGVLEGMRDEGITEALQAVVQNGFEVGIGGNTELGKRAVDVLNNAIGGALGGSVFGAASRYVENQGKPKAEPKENATAGTGPAVPDLATKPEATAPETSTPGTMGNPDVPAPSTAGATAGPDATKPVLKSVPTLGYTDSGVSDENAAAIAATSAPNEYVSSPAAAPAGASTVETLTLDGDEDLGLTPEEDARLTQAERTAADAEAESKVRPEVARERNAAHTPVATSGDEVIAALMAHQTIEGTSAAAPQVGAPLAPTTPQVEPLLENEPMRGPPVIPPDMQGPPAAEAGVVPLGPSTGTPQAVPFEAPAPVLGRAPAPVEPVLEPVAAPVEDISSPALDAELTLPVAPAPVVALQEPASVTPRATLTLKARAAVETPQRREPMVAGMQGRKPPPVVSKRSGKGAAIAARVTAASQNEPRAQAERDLRAHAQEILKDADNLPARERAVQAVLGRFAERIRTSNRPTLELVQDLKEDVAAAARAAYAHEDAASRSELEQERERQIREGVAKEEVGVKHAEARRAGAGTGQEQARRTAKTTVPGDTIRKRSEKENLQKAKRLIEKGNAPEPVQRLMQAVAARTAIGPGKGEKVRLREPYNIQITLALQDWADYEDARHTAAEAKKPKVSVEEKVKAEVTAAARTAEERAADTDEARLKRAETVHKAKNEAAQALVRKHAGTLSPVEEATYDARKVAPAIDKAIQEYNRGRPVKDHLPDNISRDQPPWVNFLVYARRMLDRHTRRQGIASPSYNFTNLLMAHDWIAEGKANEFYAFNDENKISSQAQELSVESGEEGRFEGERRPEDEAIRTALSDEIEAFFRQGPVVERKGQMLSNSTGFSYQLEREQKHTAGAMLNKSKPASDFYLLAKVFDNRVSAALKKLVGDVPVYVVPDVMVERLRSGDPNSDIPALGFYARPTFEEMARGDQGTIVIAQSVADDPVQLRHVMTHEMTHAATLAAYDTDYKGTRQLVDQLHKDALREVATLVGKPASEIKSRVYGLSNPREFIAEATSNPAFQNLLKRISLPVETTLGWKIRGLTPTSSVRSIWNAIVEQVARLLNVAGFGQQGMSYVEAITRATGGMLTSQDEMQSLARGYSESKTFTASRSGFSVQAPKTIDEAMDGLIDEPAFKDNLDEVVNYLSLKSDSAGHGSFARRKRFSWLSTTQDLRRLADQMFGATSPFHKAIDAHLAKAQIAKEWGQKGNDAALAMERFRHENATEANAVNVWLDSTTKNASDARFSNGAGPNAHFGSGKAAQNFRFRKQRRVNAELHQEYQRFSPEAKAVIDEVVGAYKEMQRVGVEEVARSILTPAVNNQVIRLPAGKSLQDAIDWVTSGDIDRSGGQMTADDKAYHNEMGGIVDKLKDATSVRGAKGIYVPLMRRGQYALLAKRDYSDPKYLPAGAMSLGEDSFVFHNMADYQRYIDTTDDHILEVKGHGNRQRVNVQNRYLSFFDNLVQANQERQRLIDDGVYTAAEVRPPEHRANGIQPDDELMPRTVNALVNSMSQMGLSGGALDAAKAAIINTQIQLMSGNRAQHRKLKREAVHGNSQDAVLAMRDYTSGFSNYIAAMRQNPKIYEGIRWAEEHNRTNPGGDIMRRQELVAEFKERSKKYDAFKDNSKIRVLSVLSYLSHLFTPAYIGMQITQMAFGTMPALSGRHGAGRTMAAMGNAFRVLGVKELYGREMSTNMGRAWKELLRRKTGDINHTGRLLDRVKGTHYEAVVRALTNAGLLDSDAGMEMDLHALGRGRIEGALDRMSRTLRAVTGAIETMNRAVTGFASYDLEMAKLERDSPGMSLAERQERALQATIYNVEQTQGGYSASNSPNAFNSLGGRLLLQFKKYALFTANYIARNIAASFGGRTPEAREARRTLAWTFLAYGMVAGLGGAFPWEVVKLPLAALTMLGIETGDPVDWMQEKSKTLFRMAGLGMSSDTIAEAMTRGLPRLLNMDLSNRVTLASLLTFGEPKDMTQEAMWAYIGRSVGGPISGLALNAWDWAYNKGFDPTKTPIKIVRDTAKAYKGAIEGTTTPSGKRDLTPFSAGETVIKGLGFQTAREAQKYEPGGDVYENRKEGRAKKVRTGLTNEWLRADTLGDEGAKREAWEDIEAYNKDKKTSEKITRGDLFRIRQRRRTEERKKAREKARELVE